MRLVQIYMPQQVCAYAQTRLSLRCSHTQKMEVYEGSDQFQTSSLAVYVSIDAYQKRLRVCD